MINKISNITISNKKKINKKKSKNKNFKATLSEQQKKSNPSEKNYPTKIKIHNKNNNSTPDSQILLVQHLMRVKELKGKSSKNTKHPSQNYNKIENTIASYFSEKNGTKEQKNIEIIIKDNHKKIN